MDCAIIMPAEVSPENRTRVEELTNLEVQFLANLDHEVRTPLSGVLGVMDLLAETELDREQRQYVAVARSCAEDLLALFDKMLEFSELTSGRATLASQEYSIEEVLSWVVSRHAERAAQKGLQIKKSISKETPPLLRGDPRRLRTLLDCLVDNGVKFTESGYVEVLAGGQWQNGGFQLQLQVRDTGIGIQPENLPKIFQGFRQLESGLGRSYFGLGLGLALVNKITRLMRGKIQVESSPGAGTTFTISFFSELA